VEENKKEQLNIIKIIFTNFHFRGNVVEKPLKVDRGTPVSGSTAGIKLACIVPYRTTERATTAVI